MNNHNSNPRPIVPSPPSVPDAPGALSGVPNPNPNPRRNFTRVACGLCKRRKVKCSGERPSCSRCLGIQAECRYDVQANETRSQSHKRKASEMEDQVQELSRVLVSLRSASDNEISTLLARIRGSNSLGHAASDIANAALLLECTRSTSMPGSAVLRQDAGRGAGAESSAINAVGQQQIGTKLAEAYLDHIQYPFGPGKRSGVWDAYYLSPFPQLPSRNLSVLEIQTIKVQAAPWTDTSDSFASHLLSYYFTFEQPFYSFVHKGAFIAGMRAGESSESSSPFRFCSKALVNGILAVACRTSFSKEAFDIPGDLYTRGERFNNAAKQAIEVEKYNPSIATLQAIWKVMWYEGTRGETWNHPYYSKLFVYIYKRLGLSKLHWEEGTIPTDPNIARYHAAIAETIWGLYWQDSLTMALEPNMKRPKIPLPRVDADPDWWYPYPLSDVPQPSRFQELLIVKAMLCEHIRDIMKFTKSSASDVKQALEIYKRLQAWKRGLPECLMLGSTKLPHVLLTHTVYDTCVMTLFRSLPEACSEDEHHNHKPSEDPRTILRDHAIHAVGVISSYRLLYTVLRTPGPVIALFTSVFPLLGFLDTSTAASDAFLQAVQALSEMSLNWPPCLSMLRGVKAIAAKSGVEIPPVAMRYIDVDGEMSRASDIPVPLATWTNSIPQRHDNMKRAYLDGIDVLMKKLSLEVD
ncbi:hypothetical protein F5B20DRAFT_283758 [Whalleya microplaca]|nr:hypothetical protein F5B20DRAFT_283758 [Whalleya microplaca]